MIRLALCLALAPVATLADDAPIGRQVGQRVANFKLDDVETGKEVSLLALARGGAKGAVLYFTGVDCPVGDASMPRLVELAATYKDKGIVVLAINANKDESVEAVRAHAKKLGLTFPTLKDPGNRVADRFLVERTCEAILIDGRATVRYRGAIDERHGSTGKLAGAPRAYLAEAIDALLAGNPVETTATTVVGCPIKRAETPASAAAKLPRIRAAAATIVEALKDAEKVEVGPVTYAGEVASILQEKCQSCHRPGQAGPFPLLSFDDARRKSAGIKAVVEERRMPPWHADPRHGTFENDRSLSPKQRATLMAWVDQGTPAGDLAKAPAAKAWPEGWSVGTPDVVFTLPAEQIVPAQGEVAYQYFSIPTGFTEDKWVQSIECRPSDRSVVHHIICFLKPAKGQRGEGEHLGGYAPGDMPSVYHPGVAKRIPAGSDLLLQVHYTPTGKMLKERASVGLIFAKEPPTHRAITMGIANGRLKIPAGDPNAEVVKRWEVKEEVNLLSFMPHMHLRGKDFKYTLISPDGSREVLLSVPAYDFAWQSYYRLAVPRLLKPGMAIECVAHYDNSAANPANPDPTKEVRWGDQTWEEMMIGYVDIVPTKPIAPGAAEARKPATNAAVARRVLGRLAGVR